MAYHSSWRVGWMSMTGLSHCCGRIRVHYCALALCVLTCAPVCPLTVMGAYKRLQVNFYVNTTNMGLYDYQNVTSDIFFPQLYITQTAVITQELADVRLFCRLLYRPYAVLIILTHSSFLAVRTGITRWVLSWRFATSSSLWALLSARSS